MNFEKEEDFLGLIR